METRHSHGVRRLQARASASGHAERSRAVFKPPLSNAINRAASRAPPLPRARCALGRDRQGAAQSNRPRVLTRRRHRSDIPARVEHVRRAHFPVARWALMLPARRRHRGSGFPRRCVCPPDVTSSSSRRLGGGGASRVTSVNRREVAPLAANLAERGALHEAIERGPGTHGAGHPRC
jgi:hypothetical protein